jgi:hypothetical protein
MRKTYTPRVYKIYALIDPRNEMIKYIGLTSKTLDKRLHWHLKSAHKKNKKLNWIRFLINNNLNIKIILIEDNLSKNEASEKEQYYIKLYSKNNLKNSTSGGEVGFTFTPQVKAKLKKSLTGRKLSETHRENIGKSSIGRFLSEESRDKLADKVKQEWQNNPERLAEMRARKGDSNPNWGGKFPGVVIHDKDGNLIGEFEHLQYAADSTSLTKSYIRACALGKKKSLKYYIEIKQ